MQHNVPYVDIARQHKTIKGELMAAIGSVIDSGQFVLGPQVEEFERQFADLSGARHAIGVNSGTDALTMSLKALGVGPGHEVITVSNSFVASTTCIKLVGARPVFVDVGVDYNLNPDLLESAVTSRTRAIIPVHLTGNPCQMDRIMELAQAHNIDVVEDCAQAVLAEYDGRRVGSFGTTGCFSLHPLKTLNACGDGGVITTDDEDMAGRLRILRNLGLESRDNCIFWSSNSRLDTIQAAVLLVKLQHCESWTDARRQNAEIYFNGLMDVEGVLLPPVSSRSKPVYHTFVIRAQRRDELQKFLTARGIGTAVHYPVPIHRTTVGQELGMTDSALPVTESLADEILSLPIYPELSPADLAAVIAEISNFYHHSD